MLLPETKIIGKDCFPSFGMLLVQMSYKLEDWPKVFVFPDLIMVFFYVYELFLASILSIEILDVRVVNKLILL